MKAGDRGYLLPLLALGALLLLTLLVVFVVPVWTCPLCDGDGADYGQATGSYYPPDGGSGGTYALECIGCEGEGDVSWIRRQRLFAAGETLE